jgi:hypothetical protein
MRFTGHVAHMEENMNACRILIGKPEGKRPLERYRRRWGDIINVDLREIGWDNRDWINLAHNKGQWRDLLNMGMKLRVP